jgi:hypothetical protein
MQSQVEAETLQLVRRCADQQVGLLGKGPTEDNQRVVEVGVQVLVNQDRKENQRETDDRGEEHLVLLSLLDALLPNVVLQRSLLGRANVSEGGDVLHETVVD